MFSKILIKTWSDKNVYMLPISGVISLTRNTKSAIPGEVSYHFVFRADDGTKYVLQVDEQTTPATVDVQVGVEISNYSRPFSSRMTDCQILRNNLRD